MRELTYNEIAILEEQGCSAEEWSDVLVDDDFTTDAVKNVMFYGHVEIGSLNGSIEVEEGFRRRCCVRNAILRNVRIGDECLIENVGGYINGYTIGDHCYISNVGVLTCQEGATFGSGTVISVLNEGGDGNVVLSEELTAQVAWMMINFPATRLLSSSSFSTSPFNACSEGLSEDLHEGAPEDSYEDSSFLPLLVGSYSRITGVREMSNVKIGENCEVQGASRLDNCTLMSTDDANTFIGVDVIMENSIVASGASVTDGAKVKECFVGESVHIGKGFSAESSLFFANSYMDNGESCASLCGPFSTSHHKSTLLIGGAFSFYNAGSATNQSNHAYKMGPIHWGMLDRGSKTASGCHILWPAHIGAFSMVMGKVQTHPQVHAFPFSYVIADNDKTWLVPGINIKTVGTWRDVDKWHKRDLRPLSSRSDLINFSFPNPYIIQYVLEAKELLKRLLDETSESLSSCDSVSEASGSDIFYHGVTIKRAAAQKGLDFYDIVIRLYLHDYFSHHDSFEEEPCGGRWLDLCGMFAPMSEIDRVAQDIAAGAISTLRELKDILSQIHDDYSRNSAGYAHFVARQICETEGIDYDGLKDVVSSAHSQWLQMVRLDAEKEYQMGDVEEQQLHDFLKKVGE